MVEKAHNFQVLFINIIFLIQHSWLIGHFEHFLNNILCNACCICSLPNRLNSFAVYNLEWTYQAFIHGEEFSRASLTKSEDTSIVFVNKASCKGYDFLKDIVLDRLRSEHLHPFRNSKLLDANPGTMWLKLNELLLCTTSPDIFACL